jgi:hypothetical protein
MKSFKFALATLVGAALLVGSFAFTSKPMTVLAYTYSPATSGRDVRTSTDANALISSEIIADAFVGDGELDNWTVGSIPAHTAGEHLLGIEFDNTVVANMEAAGNIVKTIYTNTGTLPNDLSSSNNVKFFIKQ